MAHSNVHLSVLEAGFDTAARSLHVEAMHSVVTLSLSHTFRFCVTGKPYKERKRRNGPASFDDFFLSRRLLQQGPMIMRALVGNDADRCYRGCCGHETPSPGKRPRLGSTKAAPEPRIVDVLAVHIRSLMTRLVHCRWSDPLQRTARAPHPPRIPLAVL